MTSTTKRGFHLPWANDDRKPEDEPGGAPDAGVAPPPRPILRRAREEELGRGPFDLAPAQEPTAESEAPDSTAVNPLVDVDDRPLPRVVQPAPVAEPGEPASAAMAWPEVDRAGSPTHVASDRARPPARPALVVEPGDGPGPRPTRRDNPLVAGLVKVMRDSARATRQDAMTRMRTTAAARMDELRVQGVAEATNLKKRADDDVVGIREWSKAEMTRIRDEAEQRIAGRRAQLAREARTQAAETERMVDDVKAAAVAFEAEMDRFFEALLAEEDPARLATLAEQLPEPPVFAKLTVKNGPSGQARKPTARATGSGTETSRRAAPRKPATASPGHASRSVPDAGPARLAPDAAAAAEAEAIAGLDLESEPSQDWTPGSLAAVLATAPRIDSPDDLSPEERIGVLGLDPDEAAETAEAGDEDLAVSSSDGDPSAATPTDPGVDGPAADAIASEAPLPPADAPDEDLTRIVVTGLTSVAGISAFKASLNRVPGVLGVSVTSGEDDDFVFSVAHAAATDLRRAVAGFAGFGAQMTLDEGAVVSFNVSEPTA
jgi:hypothetical protein